MRISEQIIENSIFMNHKPYHNSITCLFNNCKKVFKNKQALGTHLNLIHKISSADYAKMFKTDEWVKCQICQKEFYRPLSHQRIDRNGVAVLLCWKCRPKVSTPKIIKTKNEGNLWKQASYKTAAKNRESGLYDSDRARERAYKRKENQKKSGTYKQSKSEAIFCLFLFLKFEENNVETQVDIRRVNKLYENVFTLDFVVTFQNNKYYICFDGIYYHGLSQPITEIAKCKSPTDRVIFGTYYRDRQLEEFFSKTNDNLLRFSDIDFANFSLKKTQKLLPYYTNGISSQIDLFLEQINK